MNPIAENNWQIKNRMTALADTTKEVSSWLADLPLSSRARYSTGLAVEEMVTNIIKYGYDDEDEHLINLHIRVERDNLRMVFEDDGHRFDPTSRPPPDIEAIVESHRAGGLGIELVRRMCDQMDYERVGNLNRLTLRICRLQPDDTQFISLSALL